MRIGSLFSGAGGLDMAVEQVFGGRTVWHCEVDEAASKVLADRWPGVPNLGDITAVDWAGVEPIDVLCGGFPCQDVSAAGRRAGIRAGTRSGLWLEFANIIDQLRPRYVVIENVRGLLSGYAYRAVESANLAVGDGAGRPLLRAAGAVLGDLADLGYDAQWVTVSAASVGAPHRRERVFILAVDANADNAALDGQRTRQEPWRGDSDVANAARDGRDEGRPESTGFVGRSDAAVSGDGPVDLLPTPNAQDGNGGGCYNSDGHQSTLPGTVRELLPTPKASDGARGDCPSERRRHDPSLQAITHYLPTPTTQDGKNNAGPSQHQRNTKPLNAVVALLPTPNASDCTGGGAHPDQRDGHSRQLIDYALLADSPQWGKYGPAITHWEAVTRPAPAPTEPNRNGNPRLNAAFSEWLMGWPAGWATAPVALGLISRNDALRIIGNGVCPQQAVAALWWLLQIARIGVAA